jgi:tetratricopeptide (TPR) repeat protein
MKRMETNNLYQINEIDELIKQEKFEEALEKCKNFLLNEPNNLDLLIKRGEIEILMESDSLEAAYSTFVDLNNSYPKNPIILTNLSRICRIHKKTEEAKKFINKALEIDSNCALAWAVKGTITADLDEKYEESFDYFKKALSLDNTDYRLYYWYGFRLGDAGYHIKAIEAFKKADELFPNASFIYEQLSDWEQVSGKYEDSVLTAQKALQINPENIGAKIILGYSSSKIGDYSTAVEMLSSVESELDDSSLWELGYAYYYLQKFNESKSIFERLLKNNPENPDFLVWVGINHDSLNEPDSALSYYNRALLADPNDEFAHYHKWLLYQKLERKEEATRYLKENQFKIIAAELIVRPDPGCNWPWLDGRPADMKGANKFFLACSVDGYGPAKRAWDNSKKFAEETLGDPDKLFNEILNKFPGDKWKTQDVKNQFKLHHVITYHNRVWDVANRIVQELDGDARKIWRKGDPDKPVGIEEEYDSDVILDRLEYFLYGREKYTGTQIPRMTLGALFDSIQALGPADVKADVHVIRIIGRVVYGIEDLRGHIGNQSMAENIAIHTARLISPENPWYIDQQLFAPGATDKVCVHSNPKCDICEYNQFCFYKLGLTRDIPELPEKLPSLKEFQRKQGFGNN